jgi:hypothetical protein
LALLGVSWGFLDIEMDESLDLFVEVPCFLNNIGLKTKAKTQELDEQPRMKSYKNI